MGGLKFYKGSHDPDHTLFEGKFLLLEWDLPQSIHLPNLMHIAASIPYHTIPGRCGLDLPRTTLRSIRWPIADALPEREGRIGSVSRCRWCVATATFCWQCECVVCAREKEGRLKGLCLLFYEVCLYVRFLWGCALLIVLEPASSVIQMNEAVLSKCWLALEVRAL